MNDDLHQDQRVISRTALLTAAGLTAALLLLLLVGFVLVSVRYVQLRQDVDTACHGVVASLDLTEWVPLCR